VGDYKTTRQPFLAARKKKLNDQSAAKITETLSGVRVYIDGYLRGTTDIEMKRIVTSAGGEVRLVFKRIANYRAPVHVFFIDLQHPEQRTFSPRSG